MDEILDVDSDASIAMARELALKEGMLVGISAGAIVKAALQIANREENKGKLIVAIIPSYGERYLSTALFADTYEECQNMPTFDVDNT